MKRLVRVFGSTLRSFGILVLATLFAVSASAQNLVTNGDFDGGNTGFSSGAVFVSAGTLDPGEYSVRMTPSTANAQWCGNDPTPAGAGNLFVCDGKSGSPTVAWRQTVAVVPGASYDFSVLARNLICSGNDFDDPVIELRVNGRTIAGPTSLPENPDPDQWQLVSGTFASCSSSATLEIVTTSTAAIGNDFGLDDVTLQLSTASLATNGDFDAGNTGFTSDAVFVPAGKLSFGEYSIRTDPSTANTQWCGNDHTPGGNGNFLVCDGISGAPTVAWRQTLPVVAGQTYRFEAWVKNLVCLSDFDDPVLELRVDGTTIAGPLTLSESSDPDLWELLAGEFTPCTSTVTIEIVSTSTSAIGNDFGIDDVSVRETCSSRVVNGDFAAGNSSFGSDAMFVSAGLLSFGEYSIRADPSTANSQWCGNDPTTAGGSFLVCDGISGMATVAWRQSVDLDVGTEYAFTALAKNLICASNFADPVLELRVTDTGGTHIVAGPVTLAENPDPDVWTHLSGRFLPASTPVTLEIVTTSTAAIGNDFGLDEISVTATCPILSNGFESGDITAWQ